MYLIRLVVLKRPGFQSQKYGMPNLEENTNLLYLKEIQLVVRRDADAC